MDASPGTRSASARSLEIPVPGGAILCRHIPAIRGTSGATRPLPLLFLPGWGAVLAGFEAVIDAVDPEIDIYYLETREKGSSRMERGAGFSMEQTAADLGEAARALGLGQNGYVLMGSSFGASVAVEALADGVLTGRLPAATVLFEPMTELWLPRALRTASRFVPLSVVAVLKPLLKRIVLAGMREETQRRRAALVIDGADLRKWRQAAVAMGGWHLLEVAPRVAEPVVLVRTGGDRFHDASVFPGIAEALPQGELLTRPVPESQREQLMGRLASACARGDLPDRAPE